MLMRQWMVMDTNPLRPICKKRQFTHNAYRILAETTSEIKLVHTKALSKSVFWETPFYNQQEETNRYCSNRLLFVLEAQSQYYDVNVKDWQLQYRRKLKVVHITQTEKKSHKNRRAAVKRKIVSRDRYAGDNILLYSSTIMFSRLSFSCKKVH